jgi:hypothetical protein
MENTTNTYWNNQVNLLKYNTKVELNSRPLKWLYIELYSIFQSGLMQYFRKVLDWNFQDETEIRKHKCKIKILHQSRMKMCCSKTSDSMYKLQIQIELIRSNYLGQHESRTKFLDD